MTHFNRVAARNLTVLLLGFLAVVSPRLTAQSNSSIAQLSHPWDLSDITVGNIGTVEGNGPSAIGGPVNGTCAGATIVDLAIGSPVTVTGDNTGAPTDPVLGVNVVWEAFRTTTCADVTVGYCGTTPPFAGALITMGVGCPLSNLVFNSSSNILPNACGDGNFAIRFPALPAGTYYFPVLEASGSSGAYSLVFTATACSGTPPANVDCGTAVELTPDLACTPVSGTVELATVAGNTGIGCGNGDISDGVWYSFVATTPSHVVTVAPSAQFNAHIEVFGGTCGTPDLLACAVGPDFGSTTSATATGLTVGATYYVRVADWYAGNALTSTFTICVQEVPVGNCDANAGTLTIDAGTVCFENGTATVSATANGDMVVPAGYQFLYLLTSGVDLVIIEAAFTAPSFDVTATGLYTIHTLVYDPATLDLNQFTFGVTTGADVNALLIQGGGTICGSLDVAGAPVTVEVCSNCPADAGTLTADDATVCFENGTATVSATANGDAVVPVDFQTVYVLTSGVDLIIEAAGATPSFDVTATGSYTIHTLVYDPATLDLGIIVFGETTGADVNALLIQGGGTICGSLDVAGAPVTVELCCDAEAGTLTADDASICFVNGTVTLSATANGDMVVPSGFQSIYVLTSGTDLVIVQGGLTPSFDVTATGLYTIHTLVYDPATLDLGLLVFGETTGFDVNALLIQGGGTICGSLDVTGAPITVEDCSPVNDDCANAIELPINADGNCPDGAIIGDNTYATQETGNEPGCDATLTSYADVWYTFNSGANTEVTITLDQGVMEDWAFTVSDACTGGTELACELTPAGPIVVTTLENTTYWVRIYSNLDFGGGAEFSLCLSGTSPTFICDGGEVATTDAATAITICQDGQDDVIDFSTTSTSVESYAFVLTDEANTIVTLLAGNSLDFNALPLGNYRVWGLSYNGDLEGAIPGAPATEVTTTGACLELSTNYVEVIVEICSGIAGNETSAWSLFPNPSNGDFSLRYAGTGANTTIEVIDMDGRLVVQDQVPMTHGQVVTISVAGRLSQGMYTVRLSSGSEVRNLRLTIQ